MRADLDAFIDARVAEIKKNTEGVPETVLRHGLTRGLACQCAAYLDIKAQDEKAAAQVQT